MPTLKFVTFLAPNLLPVYRFLARRAGERLGCDTELTVGGDYDRLGDADVAFVCGLPYVQQARLPRPPVVPLAAPVLRGERFAGRPVYFSDVVVRRDSPYRCFADLRGRSWSYNEPCSQSGYGVTRHRLLRLGETGGYFGRVVEAGFHERSLRLVASGEVDASAIDCQVLMVALREQPELAGRLRVIDTLGPSTIQPVVASTRLSPQLRADLRRVLLGTGDDAEARRHLDHGFIERFAAVADEDYDDVRAMLHAAEAANFLTLR